MEAFDGDATALEDAAYFDVEVRQPAALPRRRGPRRRLFKPLNRSYWPRSVSKPYQRLAIAVLAAPLPTSVVYVALTWWAFAYSGASAERTWAMVIEAARLCLAGTYLISLVGGAIAVPYLWSTRRRSFWPWLLAGAVIGVAIAALVLDLLLGGELTRLAGAVFAVLGASVFLTLRWLAGIRSTMR